MDQNCIFCKIVSKEIPAKIEYEDEHCIVFHDIRPRAKVHVLVIPKKHIATMNEMMKEDEPIMGRVMKAAVDAAQKLEVKAYKLLISVGKEAGQEVFHIHVHVMSAPS